MAPKKAVTIDTKSENKSAGQKPETAKSGTTFESPNMMSAFTAKEKRPRVRILMGSVRRRMIGLKNILITPSSITSTTAEMGVTSIPGMMYAPIKTAMTPAMM